MSTSSKPHHAQFDKDEKAQIKEIEDGDFEEVLDTPLFKAIEECNKSKGHVKAYEMLVEEFKMNCTNTQTKIFKTSETDFETEDIFKARQDEQI